MLRPTLLRVHWYIYLEILRFRIIMHAESVNYQQKQSFIKKTKKTFPMFLS